VDTYPVSRGQKNGALRARPLPEILAAMYTRGMKDKVRTYKEVSRAQAESRLVLDNAGYAAFLKALDEPAWPNAKLKRLIASKSPWEK
jgi:hypothetical protein